MIVDDFDVISMPVAPHEANPPLIVYSYGVLTLAVAPQRFQLVARRRSQDPQLSCGVQLKQLSERHSLKGAEPPRMLVCEQLLGFLRGEALNHAASIERGALHVKRDGMRVWDGQRNRANSRRVGIPSGIAG